MCRTTPAFGILLLLASPLLAQPSTPTREGGGAKYKVALVSGSLEYKSDDTLPLLQKWLEEKYAVECVRLFRKTDEDIPGLEKLADYDLAVFYTRRLKIAGEQLKAVKAYCESGKPVVGLRTASHGFQTWLEMDAEVYGGDYKNHHKAGPKCAVKLAEKQAEHPVLKGVKSFDSVSSLYRNQNVAKDVTVLLTGSIPDNTEPVAWVRERKLGDKTQRVFYTSLGHPQDFEEEPFRTLLLNGIKWAATDGLKAK